MRGSRCRGEAKKKTISWCLNGKLGGDALHSPLMLPIDMMSEGRTSLDAKATVDSNDDFRQTENAALLRTMSVRICWSTIRFQRTPASERIWEGRMSKCMRHALKVETTIEPTENSRGQISVQRRVLCSEDRVGDLRSTVGRADRSSLPARQTKRPMGHICMKEQRKRVPLHSKGLISTQKSQMFESS